jgi:Tfp pilus assembly protein FimT
VLISSQWLDVSRLINATSELCDDLRAAKEVAFRLSRGKWAGNNASRPLHWI